MLTNTKFLRLIYDAATCYVPTEQLNQEQSDRFDNITYRWCKCQRCKEALKMGSQTIIPQYAGHANQQTLEICLSRPLLTQHITNPYGIFLLALVTTTLHEIVHIIFPEFNEDETINKTFEWLRTNKWVAHEANFERTTKRQLEKELREM